MIAALPLRLASSSMTPRVLVESGMSGLVMVTSMQQRSMLI
jgi:hypothetical protein